MSSHTFFKTLFIHSFIFHSYSNQYHMIQFPSPKSIPQYPPPRGGLPSDTRTYHRLQPSGTDTEQPRPQTPGLALYGPVSYTHLHHLIRVFHNRRGIRSQEKLSFTDAHHQRTALACSDYPIRIVLVEHLSLIHISYINAPQLLASSTAASVSAVSPLCEMAITTSLLSITGSR